jgi:hypothetical protein
MCEVEGSNKVGVRELAKSVKDALPSPSDLTESDLEVIVKAAVFRSLQTYKN